MEARAGLLSVNDGLPPSGLGVHAAKAINPIFTQQQHLCVDIGVAVKIIQKKTIQPDHYDSSHQDGVVHHKRVSLRRQGLAYVHEELVIG